MDVYLATSLLTKQPLLFTSTSVNNSSIEDLWSRDGAVVRALASHRCGLGSILELDAICRLSLLLVLFSAPRGFSPGTPVFPSPQKPTFPNSNSIQISVDEKLLCGGATANSYSILFYSIRLSKDIFHQFHASHKHNQVSRSVLLAHQFSSAKETPN